MMLKLILAMAGSALFSGVVVGSLCYAAGQIDIRDHTRIALMASAPNSFGPYYGTCTMVGSHRFCPVDDRKEIDGETRSDLLPASSFEFERGDWLRAMTIDEAAAYACGSGAADAGQPMCGSYRAIYAVYGGMLK